MKSIVIARHAWSLLLCLGLVVSCRPPPQPQLPAVDPGVATRIVTLAPHLAELVYSAGAGDRLVGVVEFSDFPLAVRDLPHVGNAFRVDYEAIAGLKPDLVLGWTSGNPPETLQRLSDMGLRVVALEPGQLVEIATQIETIGTLAGTTVKATAEAARFRARLEAVRSASAGAVPVSVFVQLSERPYFTVTDQHFLGQGVRLCGGRNIFGDLPGITATVSLEAIVDAAPDVIIASDMGSASESPLVAWREWRELPAVKHEHLFALDADLLSRPSERILDGIEQVCRVLDQSRVPAH